MKFRKKPVIVDAIQFDGGNYDAIESFMSKHGANEVLMIRNGVVMIGTLEGDMTVSPSDWVIRGVMGEFYPCKDDIFWMTYEPAGAGYGDAPAFWNHPEEDVYGEMDGEPL